MLKKTDVYNFIEKVQSKAVNSVKEKYESELNTAIENELNKPENQVLKDAFKKVALNIKAGNDARNIIRKHIPRFDRWDSCFHDIDCIKEAFGENCNFPAGFDSIQSVHVEYIEKIKRTKEEYAKIMRICQNKKTGDQGRTALIALGFDVTYLDNLSNLPVVINPATMDIDKTLIFPCGESGI